MPIYIDIHRSMRGMTQREVKEAFQADLEAQKNFGVKFIKFWHDHLAGTMCCLIDAPDAETAGRVHQKAHGRTADKIIEVGPDELELYLGASHESDSGQALTPKGVPDGGYRTFTFTGIVDPAEPGRDISGDAVLAGTHDEILRAAIAETAGRRLKHAGRGFMASHLTAAQAVDCAMVVQREFARRKRKEKDFHLGVRIGISGGAPVSDGERLFDSVLSLGSALRDQAKPGKIIVSESVRTRAGDLAFNFKNLGKASFDGRPGPEPLYEVLY